MNLVQLKIKTPACDVYAIASEEALRGIYWDNPDFPTAEENSPAETILQLTESQLKEYFAGTRKTFDIPLDLVGTEFQVRVWKELQKIPYGKTISYLELAKRVGNMKASRAVGSANGKNPISIIVPCHRVINVNGGLGGFAGGLPVKSFLLELEKAIPSQSALF